MKVNDLRFLTRRIEIQGNTRFEIWANDFNLFLNYLRFDKI